MADFMDAPFQHYAYSEEKHNEEFNTKYNEELNACEYGTTAEQKNESHYDTRHNADDDMMKNRIEFPTDKLYGRDVELRQLNSIFEKVCGGAASEEKGGEKEVLSAAQMEAPRQPECSREDEKEEDPCNEILSSSSSSSSQILFLAGYSGTGKSSLVHEFMHQTKQNRRKKSKSNNKSNVSPIYGPLFICGKYGDLKTSDPFSAITASIMQLASDLLHSQDKADLESIRTRLRLANIEFDSNYGKILAALIPKLKRLLKDSCTQGSNASTSESSQDDSLSHTNGISAAVSYEQSVIQNALRNLIKALCSPSRPLVMFIDDLQWADEASIKLLSFLLKDKSMKHFFFIGSYRSNEVEKDHSFYKLMAEIEEANKGKNNVHNLELFNLSPNHIGEFISDAICRTPDEVQTIANVIYGKTLGNIFFVIQALEELVRKNALYYDVMFFQWEWSSDLTTLDLQKFLTDDVVEMVKSKIYTLPDILQMALSLAAYTSHTIQLDILFELLQKTQGEQYTIDYQEFRKLMDLAVLEGVILSKTGDVNTEKRSFRKRKSKIIVGVDDYTFAHDKIREAACLAIEGEDKDKLLVGIATVLLEHVRGKEDDNETDWMLFVAAHHLNAVPPKYTDSEELARLNFRVAKIAISKAAFEQAIDLLHQAEKAIGAKSNDYWKGRDQSKYDFILDLYNSLSETEYVLGNFSECSNYANTIVENAKCLDHKCTAYQHIISSYCEETNQNYELTTRKALEILQLYGWKVSQNPSQMEVTRENMRLRFALGTTTLAKLANGLPLSSEDGFLALLGCIYLIAHKSKNDRLGDIMISWIIRSSIYNKCITQGFARIAFLGFSLRAEGKIKKAYSYANAASAVLERYERLGRETGAGLPSSCLIIKMGLYAAIIPMRMTYRDAMHVYFQLHTNLISHGESGEGLAAGMLAAFSYFVASFPLNSLLEPKLHLFEELSHHLAREGFVSIFQYQRQFLYNLQGKQSAKLRMEKHGTVSFEGAATNPTKLVGDAFDEDAVLGAMEDESNAKKMTLRDISILRLQLAFIFIDFDAMDEMLDNLNTYPVFDSPLVRQQLRMTYTGFAAFALIHARTHDIDNFCDEKLKFYDFWGNKSYKFFRGLAKFGSPNAQPVYLCLKALRKPTLWRFENAIECCYDAELLNLAAMMNEHCCYYLQHEMAKEKEVEQTAQDDEFVVLSMNCLARAMWLYQDWGAIAKVNKLKEQHPFLRTAKREKAASKLSSLLREANQGIKASG